MPQKTSTGLLKDFSNALAQYLFYWGRDVTHPQGNLLCKFGLEKYKRKGVSGSSCYKMNYQGDIIELHSFCVGRYSQKKPSLLYTRQDHKCWVYKDDRPPPPGQYNPTLINKSSIEKLEVASRNFLEWLLDYESWVAANTHRDYRTNCYASFKRLPRSRTWLPPQDGLLWLHDYMHKPDTLSRAKDWKRQREKPSPTRFAKPSPIIHARVKRGQSRI